MECVFNVQVLYELITEKKTTSTFWWSYNLLRCTSKLCTLGLFVNVHFIVESTENSILLKTTVEESDTEIPTEHLDFFRPSLLSSICTDDLPDLEDAELTVAFSTEQSAKPKILIYSEETC